MFYTECVLAGIGIQPTITELRAAPGQTKTGVFRVVNGGKETVLVKAEIEDWLKLRVGESPLDVDDWLFMDETEFELEPAQVKNIGYQIIAPEGVEGELVAMVFFSSAVTSGGAFGITSRFGVSIYVGIEETEVVEAEIEKIELADSRLLVSVKNLGNVHIRPSGRVLITDSEGRLIEERKILYMAVIFKGKSHVYPLDLTDAGLPSGDYGIEAVFDTGTIYEKNKIFRKKISLYVE